MSEGSAGEVKIILTIDGVSYSTGMKQARDEAAKLSGATGTATAEMRRQMQEARGTVMVLGEEIGVHLPRHVQAFVAKLPGVASAMSAAFNAVAVIAIGKAIYEVTEKVVEFVKKNEDAARANGAAWLALSQPMQQTNDEMRLANDKIENAIAKIENKPRNGIKEAIDEAIVSADTLGMKLGQDISKIAAELKKQQIGWLDQIQGRAGSGDVTERSTALRGQLDSIDVDGHTKLENLRSQNATEEQLAAATRDLNAKRQEAIDAELAWVQQQITIARNPSLSLMGTTDKSKRLGLLNNYGADLSRASDSISLNQEQAADQTTLGNLQAAQDAYNEWRKQYNLQLEEARKQVVAKVKWLVGTENKGKIFEKEHPIDAARGAEAFRMQREDFLPANASRDVVGEMSEDAGQYGQRWKAYNDAVRQGAEQQATLREQMDRTRLIFEEQTGSISKQQLAVRELAADLKSLEDRKVAVNAEMNEVGSDPSLTDPQRAGQMKQLQNQYDSLDGQAAQRRLEGQQAGVMLDPLQQLRSSAAELAQQFTNVGEILSNVFTRSLQDFNDTFVKAITTHSSSNQHLWRNLGSSVVGNASKDALQYGEGSVLKALGIGRGSKKPTGTPSDPIHVKSVDGGGGVPGSGGSAVTNIASKGLLGMLNNSDFFGKIFGGKLFGSGSIFDKIQGFAEGGSIPSNLPSLVGENGPELFMPASSGRIVPNKKLNFGGGGDTFHIDARGTDPELTRENVARAISAARTAGAGDAIRVITDKSRRKAS